jgi:diguanylate cyclase (GGDEF)-like protein
MTSSQKAVTQSGSHLAWPRFADMPLTVKIGAAPAFALLMLIFVSVAVLVSQTYQRAALDSVVRYDDVRSRLAADAQIITAANGSLFEILAKQAAGGTGAQSATALLGVSAQVDAAGADLRALQGALPPQDRSRYDSILTNVSNYHGAIQVLGSMLGIDFNAGADFIRPYDANYTRITRPLSQLSSDLDTQSAAIAASSRRQAARIDLLLLVLLVVTSCTVFTVCTVIIRATYLTVSRISEATLRLALGRGDVDLDALRRHDEFRTIVESLFIFAQNQKRIAALNAEREAMQIRQYETQKLAEVDPLTELLNRRAMRALLEGALAGGGDAPEDCVAMLDLDHFKAVNDDFGHLMGDDVLRATGRILRDTLRTGDIAARWGGEEFLILLPGTSLATAVQCLERLRKVVAAARFGSEDSGPRVTISCGVVQLHPKDTLVAVLTRVDMALYMAKNSGRNRVICETELLRKQESSYFFEKK